MMRIPAHLGGLAEPGIPIQVGWLRRVVGNIGIAPRTLLVVAAHVFDLRLHDLAQNAAPIASAAEE